MTDSTDKPFSINVVDGPIEHPINSLTVNFSDGTSKTIIVNDTFMVATAVYLANSEFSVDGSFPTRHTFVARWVEDRDDPIA